MSEINKSGPRVSRERAGEISFLLTKWALNQLSPEMLARAVGISSEEMTLYQAIIKSEVDTSKLYHWDDCPLCVIGEMRFQNIELPSRRTRLKCSVCQAIFYRENSS